MIHTYMLFSSTTNYLHDFRLLTSLSFILLTGKNTSYKLMININHCQQKQPFPILFMLHIDKDPLLADLERKRFSVFLICWTEEVGFLFGNRIPMPTWTDNSIKNQRSNTHYQYNVLHRTLLWCKPHYIFETCHMCPSRKILAYSHHRLQL